MLFRSKSAANSSITIILCFIVATRNVIQKAVPLCKDVMLRSIVNLSFNISPEIRSVQ